MAVKFYQIPVTEMYTVQAQAIMQSTITGPQGVTGGGDYPDDPEDPTPHPFD